MRGAPFRTMRWGDASGHGADNLDERSSAGVENIFEYIASDNPDTVRAVALCARVGAQWQSWPAFQRNR
jgi:hypothetical protein